MWVEHIDWFFISIFLHAALINWLGLINKSSKCGWTVRDDWQPGLLLVVFLSHRAAATLLLRQAEADCQNLQALCKRYVKIWFRQLCSALLKLLNDQMRELVELCHEPRNTNTKSQPLSQLERIWPTIRTENALRPFNCSKKTEEFLKKYFDLLVKVTVTHSKWLSLLRKLKFNRKSLCPPAKPHC